MTRGVMPMQEANIDSTEGTYRSAPNALARAGAMLAAGLGFRALLGWVLDLPRLASLGPGWIPMAPSTALLFLLFGAAIFICARTPLTREAQRIGMAIGSAGALIALLLFCLSTLGMRLEAERLGIAVAGTLNGVPIGHISPATALYFVLAGVSLLASLSSSPERPGRATAGSLFACLLLFASTVFLLGYLFGTPLLYGGQFIPPALTTSLGFAALGVSLFALAASRVWTPGDRID